MIFQLILLTNFNNPDTLYFVIIIIDIFLFIESKQFSIIISIFYYICKQVYVDELIAYETKQDDKVRSYKISCLIPDGGDLIPTFGSKPTNHGYLLKTRICDLNFLLIN